MPHWYPLWDSSTTSGPPSTSRALSRTSLPYRTRMQTSPCHPAAAAITTVSWASPSQLTLSPGRYCNGMSFGGGYTWTLSPGIYYIKSGQFNDSRRGKPDRQRRYDRPDNQRRLYQLRHPVGNERHHSDIKRPNHGRDRGNIILRRPQRTLVQQQLHVRFYHRKLDRRDLLPLPRPSNMGEAARSPAASN